MKHLRSHSKKFFSKVGHKNIPALGVFVVVLVALFVLSHTSMQRPSVEVGFTNLSPSGESGGRIVPASCNGGANAADYGQACNPANACGSTNSGSYDTCGNCSVSAPANPTYYGTACSTSVCGQSVAGTYNCSDVCVATSPPTCSPPTVNICSGDGCTPTTNSPLTVVAGTDVVISWSCPSPNTTSSNTFNSSRATSGTATVTVNSSSTYTVQCDQTSTQAHVTATAINPTFSLAATPSRVQANAMSSLKWWASGVSSCALSGPSVSASATADGSGNVASSASPKVTSTAAITGQSTFTLTCQTTGGPISQSINVTLIPTETEI